MPKESHFFSYLESQAILEGIIFEIQTLLDDEPDTKEFYFQPIWHCFQQYEIMLNQLREQNGKFGLVPKLIETIEESAEFQYDMITRRHLGILVTYTRTCLTLILGAINTEREKEIQEIIDKRQVELQQPKQHSSDELNIIVKTILTEFQTMIEDQGCWKLLWNRNEDKHVWEDTVQRLFFMTASSICQMNNIDVSPETNKGTGEVDFKFSSTAAAKHLVEFKMSDNPKVLSGYSKQLEAYKRAERTKCASYVVVEVHDMKQTKQELAALATDKETGSNVFFIDARPRLSASKL
ncbi:MAG: hypothetical protein K2W82_09795 [Candidatus Obscuribacterales bacterium]|nr:hypothetical protein [Candidatus Obscuribacterales bacterium]